MMNPNSPREAGSNPRHHVARVKHELNELTRHLREDITRIDDPKARALFETAAETLAGLEKAFSDYEKQNEAAWK